MHTRFKSWLARMRAPYPPRLWREPRAWLKHALVDLSWRLARRECRDVEESLCCCGSEMTPLNYLYCEGRCRSAREWAAEGASLKWQRRFNVAPDSVQSAWRCFLFRGVHRRWVLCAQAGQLGLAVSPLAWTDYATGRYRTTGTWRVALTWSRSTLLWTTLM